MNTAASFQLSPGRGSMDYSMLNRGNSLLDQSTSLNDSYHYPSSVNQSIEGRLTTMQSRHTSQQPQNPRKKKVSAQAMEKYHIYGGEQLKRR